MFNKFYKRIDRGVLALYNVLNKMLEELNMTLVEIIIKYRTEHNLSQRAFAERCGVSNGYISMLEMNRNPSTEAPITAEKKLDALKYLRYLEVQ